VAFAAVLMVVVKSGPVKSALASVITTALGIGVSAPPPGRRPRWPSPCRRCCWSWRSRCPR
jgi:hypothetical protein